jgi:hypothetical protein
MSHDAVDASADILPALPGISSELLSRPLQREHRLVICYDRNGTPLYHRESSPQLFGGFFDRFGAAWASVNLPAEPESQSCLLIVAGFEHEMFDEFPHFEDALKAVVKSFLQGHNLEQKSGTGFEVTSYRIKYEDYFTSHKNVLDNLSIEHEPTIERQELSELETLEDIERRIRSAMEPFREEFQATLRGWEGRSFGSIHDNKQIAAKIQDLLNLFDNRVECTREDCHRPALIRFKDTGHGGYFQFEHFTEGRQTNHRGHKALPVLKLVPAPPDARRRGSGDPKP